MLESYGGHPMAAGLAIDPQRIVAFRDALSDTVRAMLAEVEPPTLQIDGCLGLEDLTLDFVQEIERLAPFGAGNPPLTLVTRDLRVTSDRAVGRGGEHLVLTVEDGEGVVQKVVWWQAGGSPLPEDRFDLAYVLRSSDFRGQREVQVQWVDAHPREQPPAALRPERVSLQLVDYRQVPNPRRTLDRLRSEEEVQVWAEAAHRAQMGGRDRRDLEPHPSLAIWTAPPSPDVLRSVLEKVAPQKVILFAVDPALDTLQAFLQRLAGLVKRVLSAEGGGVGSGVVNVSQLAAATAQREATVRAGLDWLGDRGQIAILSEEGGETLLLACPGDARRDTAADASRLTSLLAETAAFRSYLRRVGQEEVLALLEVR
jgi:single-stranded-DNA-specific exonuclease